MMIIKIMMININKKNMIVKEHKKKRTRLLGRGGLNVEDR